VAPALRLATIAVLTAFGLGLTLTAPLFNRGLGPIDPGPAPTPERCGECHEAEYADWAASRHRSSWSNPLMQHGYIVEPRQFCVNCHAPLPAQAAEVRANAAWYKAQDLRRYLPIPVKQPEPHADQGITCAVCHVRDGAVLVASEAAFAPHDTVVADLGDPAFCKDCHEFPMPVWRQGVLSFTDTMMQGTYTEWLDWQNAGNVGTCQSCHMPGGRHTFLGANDIPKLKRSVSVDARRDRSRVIFAVASVGVGHHHPSGDLFRNMTLDVDTGHGWRRVDRIGREFEVVDGPDGPEKVLVNDTSLRPGLPRTSTVTARGAVRWRLVYHFGSSQDEVTSGILMDEMAVELAAGVVP
jgi:hypothetical protein